MASLGQDKRRQKTAEHRLTVFYDSCVKVVATACLSARLGLAVYRLDGKLKMDGFVPRCGSE